VCDTWEGVSRVMAEIEINDVLRLSCRMLFDNTYSVVNTWTVNVDAGGPATFASWQTAIQAYTAALYTYMNSYIVNNITVDSIGVQNLTQGLVFGSMSWSGWGGGAATGDSLPLGCALMVYGRTLVPRVQIRKYLGVIAEIESNDGVFTGTVRGAAENMMTYHITQQTPDTGKQVTGIAYNMTTLAKTYATSVASSSEVAYQRRRRRGRGS